jgi:Secretion system C-terminal sorting domain
MKKQLLLLLCILSMQNASAQFNLVPNPSFEDTVYCPFGTNQLDACANWLNFGNSPDYFNVCSNPAFAVPNSVFGFQYAHTGNAYAGAAFYRGPNTPNSPNYREPIGIELLSSLTIGQKYFISFYVVNAGVNNGSIACDKQGINFYTVPFDSCCPPTLLNTAKLFTDSILLDTLNWTKISGSFIADSAYRFLCINNFFNDINTDTVITSPFSIPYHAYYYIDDVCVSTDSIFNETWTGLNQFESKSEIIDISPNPSNGYFTVDSPVPILRYRIFNMQGQLIEDLNFNATNNFELDLQDQPSGIYILNIYSKHYTSTHKIILTH